MVRACVAVLVCLVVSAPAWAQPLYVTGTIGSSTPLETRYDYDSIREDDGLGTALTLGGRVGLHLGAWWGVELDVTHRLEQEARQEPDILPGSFEIVQYDTRVMTGVDCRVHIGNDLLVIPSLRVLAGGGAWSIRPSVGVGWAF